MDFCPNYAFVAFAHKSKSEALFTRLRCKQWSCEYCAAKNRAIWAAFLKDKLPRVAPDWWLLTLTAHSQKRSAAGSLKNIRSNIDKFLKRVRRIWGGVEYVRVYERHPTSEAIHAHLIISGLTDFVVPGCSSKLQPMYLAVVERRGTRGTWAVNTWAKKTAQECGMGYIVDVERIDSVSRAANYVAKYLTKSQQDLKQKGLRHVQVSRGIGSPGNPADLDWQVRTFITATDFGAGQSVLDLNTGVAIDPDYWNESDSYPPEGG